jgi:hypothetical protein
VTWVTFPQVSLNTSRRRVDTWGSLTKRQTTACPHLIDGDSPVSRPISNVPLDISEIVVGHVKLVARPGTRFPVSQMDGQLTVSVPELGVHVIARDRRVLTESVELAVARAWRNVRLACFDDETDECAQRMRARLERWFREY